MTDSTQAPRFTIKGRHVLVAFVLFFGLIIAVDSVFISLALRTFSGQVAKNPYEAGLLYDRTLEKRAAQAKLGWGATLAAGADGVVELVITDREGRGVDGLKVEATMERPATDAGGQTLSLTGRGDGRYVGSAELSGAWDIEVIATGPDGVRFETGRRVVGR
jgi:nitrogen fixation protein FixH